MTLTAKDLEGVHRSVVIIGGGQAGLSIEGVAATRLRRDRKGRYLVGTDHGEPLADQVVLATGPYQISLIPRLADRLPDELVQIHSCAYRSPAQLPPGEVLVIGTGQSGCQIAEDLHLAGRPVHLAVGSAPRVTRFYRGRDVVAWLEAAPGHRPRARRPPHVVRGRAATPQALPPPQRP
ncbi:MAG: NAD(P)-binding domain-containing protein [Pseudonocardiaceae bacterium]